MPSLRSHVLEVGAALALLACACNSSPANVAGTYTINLTNGDNGCMLGNWAAGGTTSNVTFVLTQSDAAATGVVQGLAGAALSLLLGSASFNGSVSGDDISLVDYGNLSQTSGGCTWTTTASIAGSLSGDLLTGTITYADKTNGSPDCGYRATCTSIQKWNGTRPPM